jgi:hypothetical protein
MFWDEPIPVADAHRFGTWLCRDHLIHGLARVEVYPKQSKATNFSHFLRLPGHHHTRHHWSRAWNGTGWLDGEPAVRYILGLSSLVTFGLPPEAEGWQPSKRGKKAASVATGEAATARPAVRPVSLCDASLDFNVALSRDALTAYSCEHLHNDDIFKIGAALSNLGDAGFDVWMAWLNNPDSPYWRDRSANRHRYTEAYFVEMWDRFENGQKYDIGLGTVYFLAQRAGWDRQTRSKEIGRKIRGRRVLVRAAQASVRDSVADQSDNADESGQACPRPSGQGGSQLPEAADR